MTDPSEDDLPPEWRVCRSTRHPDMVYYYNTFTRESVWEKPKDVGSPEEKTDKGNLKRKVTSTKGTGTNPEENESEKKKKKYPSGDYKFCLEKLEREGVKEPFFEENRKKEIKKGETEEEKLATIKTAEKDSVSQSSESCNLDRRIKFSVRRISGPTPEDSVSQSAESRNLDRRLKFAVRRIKAGPTWKPGQPGSSPLCNEDTDSESIGSFSSTQSSPARLSVISSSSSSPRKRPSPLLMSSPIKGVTINRTGTLVKSPIEEPLLKNKNTPQKALPDLIESSGEGALSHGAWDKSEKSKKSLIKFLPLDGEWLGKLESKTTPLSTSRTSRTLVNTNSAKKIQLYSAKHEACENYDQNKPHSPDSNQQGGVWVEQKCERTISPSLHTGGMFNTKVKEPVKADGPPTQESLKTVITNSQSPPLLLVSRRQSSEDRDGERKSERTCRSPERRISSEVVEMEVEHAEEDQQVLHDLMEVREVLPMDTMEVTGGLTRSFSNTCCQQDLTDEIKQGGVYVVLDTNILIQSLKFVDELKDHAFPVIGRPSLVIPWVVMQELDALKDQQRGSFAVTTKVKAGKPILFLNKCFEAGHPRIIGQTPSEARQSIEGFEIECNDDRVLQCCIHWQKMFPKADVVLLTLDRNLRNKAMIMKIPAFTTENLGDYLHKPMKNSVEVSQPHSEDIPVDVSKMPTTSALTTDDKEEEEALSDELFCEMKSTLQDVFALVLETEMKSIYEDLWLDVVYIKPPWTLHDLLECIKKHWIAVFGQILPRHLENSVEKIRKNLRYKEYGRNLQDISEIIQDNLKLCHHLKDYSSYDGAVDCGIEILNDLRQKCETTLKDGFPKPIPKAEVNSQELKVSGSPSIDLNGNSTRGVEEQFQLVWESIYNCSKSVEDRFNGDQDVADSQRPAAVEIFARFAKALVQLQEAYSRMLQVDPAESSSHMDTFDKVSEIINDFAHAFTIQPWSGMTGTLLQQFYLKEGCRQLLHNGNIQLRDFLERLKTSHDKLSEEEKKLFS